MYRQVNVIRCILQGYLYPAEDTPEPTTIHESANPPTARYPGWLVTVGVIALIIHRPGNQDLQQPGQQVRLL